MELEQEERSGRKKKKIIVIVILLVLILVAGGVLGFVLTMPKETGNDIGYSSNLHADVSATYQLEGGEEIDVGTISFTPNSGTAEVNSLNFGNIHLSGSTVSVVFRYSFVNKDDVPCRVTLVDNAAEHNVQISYIVKNGDYVVQGVTPEQGFIVGAGETWIVEQEIRIIADRKEDAYYTSGDTNILYWALERID